MPSELLHLPPLYTFVGIYRLLTDPSIRGPVLDKVKHASIRGLIVGLIYAVVSWQPLRYFVKRFLIGEGWKWFGLKKAQEVVQSHGSGKVEFMGVQLDIVLYTHLLILLPQISSILRFFVYKNLKLARSRAYALTVSSRRKPPQFWNQGYIEEWAEPPRASARDVASGHGSGPKWISWVLWWPTMLVLRHYFLIPLSPSLPLLTPLFVSFLRSITTAEYLHQPYFETKGMSKDEIWRWVEERKWAYRAFGFAASLLESIPIAGLFFSIPNRIGAAMMAFDMEKRQHLFSAGVIHPLQPKQVGFYGMGAVHDLGVDIQAAEKEIERKFGSDYISVEEKGNLSETGSGAAFELKGMGLGSTSAGREKLL